MKKNSTRYFWFLLTASLFGGCASIIDGTTQEVSFNSTPDGATVTLDGRVIGKTPVSISIKKKSGQALVFSKDGYKTVTMQLETRMNSWFWGNIILGGVIGSTTDGISGAINEYSPSQYMITLQQEGVTSLESKTITSDNQKAKEFIMLTYKNIVSDLNKGEGQYQTSLFEILKISKGDQAEARKKIRALSEAYSNIPEFADRVIALYLK
jgi:hypothetical protein